MAQPVPKANRLLEAKYVRINRVRDNGLVEFDFAIGAPEIFVELIMPQTAFEDFCLTNRTIDVTGTPLDEVDFDARLSRVMVGKGR